MIRSLGFLGERTAAFVELTALYGHVVGLEPIPEPEIVRPGRGAS